MSQRIKYLVEMGGFWQEPCAVRVCRLAVIAALVALGLSIINFVN